MWKGKLSDAKAGGNPIKVQEAQVGIVMLLTIATGFCTQGIMKENANELRNRKHD